MGRPDLPDLELEIVGIFPWDFGAGVIKNYRRGRVLLVGDAAHRTTPRGATGHEHRDRRRAQPGLEARLGDQGLGDRDALLDSYEDEREPVGRANATASLQTMIDRPSGDWHAHDFGVEYASAAIVGGTPLAGQRAPHAGSKIVS